MSTGFTGSQHSPRLVAANFALPRRSRRRLPMLSAWRPHTRLGVVLALAGATLAGFVATLGPGVALGAEETYGEIGHFGAAGVGHGQFKLTSGTDAFGVDQTDNTIYVGDEPKKREYRIQKFSESGTYLASTPNFLPPNHAGIEGIAIDPTLKRIYVLAEELRSRELTRDREVPAAGTLYAFSTEPVGEELPPASGTTEGVLAGPETLDAQSDEVGKALLKPSGIAVDPTSHDVILMGEVDLGKSSEIFEPRVALQRVGADGVLGARYVDSTDFFASGSGTIAANSPVVSQDGNVYVFSQSNELAQIPSNFASSEPPTPFIQFDAKGSAEEAVMQVGGTANTNHGDGLSLASQGGLGPSGDTLYAKGEVFISNGQGGGSSYTGVAAFDATTGLEVGWTGGQSTQVGESCAINFGGPTYPTIAAGGDHRVFILDPGKTVPIKPPRVVEFGPGGHGCPTAQASEPTASVAGKQLSPSETVSPGTPVTFSSTLTQANALSVEWSFGDGQTKTVSKDEYQQTEITHSFVRGGELTVTETIHTDDLATPTIVKEMKISVSTVSVAPTAVLEGPLEVTLGASGHEQLVYLPGGGFALEGAGSGNGGGALAAFDGSASYDPNPPGSNHIDAYHWTFGDGSSETTTTPTTSHDYKDAGLYKVELTVTDELGLTSEASALIVRVNAPSPPPVVQEVHPPAPVTAPSPPTGSSGGGANTAKSAAVPAVALAGRSLLVSPAGTVQMVVTCPADETNCAGAVTLRTLHAVAVGASGARGSRKRHKAVVLTLASGRFTVAGGRQEALALRLTSQARRLLTHARLLPAQAAIVARDPTGAAHTAQIPVTLRASSGSPKKSRKS